MYIPYKIPVSVKGIVFDGDAVWLRKNQRNEWGLPGGKVDRGEQPAETAVREMREELGYEVEAKELVQAFIFVIPDSMDEHDGVLILSYRCQKIREVGEMEHIGEAGRAEFRLTPLDELESLAMPEFYKEAITKAYDMMESPYHKK